MPKRSEDEVTTEELPPRIPILSARGTSHVHFEVEGVRYEGVRELEVRPNGERLLEVARRVGDGALSGPCLVRQLLSPFTFIQRQRMFEEVQLAFRLNHPNISQIFHVRVDEEEDAAYAVMEYVGGPSLETLVCAALVRGQPLSEGFGLYVGAEVADALHYAHTLTSEEGVPLGIIHRDVSPRHIALGQHGEVKVLDFGAAYSLLAGREESPEMLLRGDVAYSSPEYLRKERLTARSDVFSLGVMLVEVLTGKHLFEVHDLPVMAANETQFRLEAQPSLPLQQMQALMKTFNPDVVEKAVAHLNEDLKAVLHTALRLNPQERFAMAADMRDALRGVAHAQLHEPYGRGEAAVEAARVVSEGGVLRDQVEFGEAGLYPAGLEKHELGLKKE
ncbi:serine/threonine protein kinase [Myxococcus llanfairpwllgwyngyllgogerychwyrndrobwllllantysiliogogogochensis]|uniref:non-specific serine/threonine protein kinase n=1 Tax=Myxococcus llanfairpwllgwyngyllgogerychwyrndrobwllllantysiliogogogochensis TaxID=2590453 RepID=A0A540WN38_9BACT|nr:serine/threonine-protein kinase [Myxococcus llanfairpwllgwyngyllgogerychwyrndrobwllllantysiliogogogochensis]TQF10443.1 serine/threonine protein kinase [Myxococcus llanfairpwllgwyngyllgogerychwyrndrobwllllantysiliogogogochensis]